MADAVVIVASTRAARGEYDDKSGALLVDWLRGQGFDVGEPVIVADADMPAAMNDIFGAGAPRVVLTTGGTGIAADDQTVEAVRPHLDKELPGLMVEFFRRGVESVATAVLSGGVAGIAGRSFVMTLPGSTGGVKDGIAVLEPVLGHIVKLLEGETDHGVL